mgnify:CR=1 FL=1
MSEYANEVKEVRQRQLSYTEIEICYDCIAYAYTNEAGNQTIACSIIFFLVKQKFHYDETEFSPRWNKSIFMMKRKCHHSKTK